MHVNVRRLASAKSRISSMSSRLERVRLWRGPWVGGCRGRNHRHRPGNAAALSSARGVVGAAAAAAAGRRGRRATAAGGRFRRRAGGRRGRRRSTRRGPWKVAAVPARGRTSVGLVPAATAAAADAGTALGGIREDPRGAAHHTGVAARAARRATPRETGFSYRHPHRRTRRHREPRRLDPAPGRRARARVERHRSSAFAPRTHSAARKTRWIVRDRRVTREEKIRSHRRRAPARESSIAFVVASSIVASSAIRKLPSVIKPVGQTRCFERETLTRSNRSRAIDASRIQEEHACQEEHPAGGADANASSSVVSRVRSALVQTTSLRATVEGARLTHDTRPRRGTPRAVDDVRVVDPSSAGWPSSTSSRRRSVRLGALNLRRHRSRSGR